MNWNKVGIAIVSILIIIRLFVEIEVGKIELFLILIGLVYISEHNITLGILFVVMITVRIQLRIKHLHPEIEGFAVDHTFDLKGMYRNRDPTEIINETINHTPPPSSSATGSATGTATGKSDKEQDKELKNGYKEGYLTNMGENSEQDKIEYTKKRLEELFDTHHIENKFDKQLKVLKTNVQNLKEFYENMSADSSVQFDLLKMD